MRSKIRVCLFILPIALNACGDATPVASDYERRVVLAYEADYERATDFIERAEIAQKIADAHWDPAKSSDWISKAKDNQSNWKKQNCKAGFVSEAERELLGKLNGLPKPPRNNDFYQFARFYESLFALCGDNKYAESYAEFKALAEFDSRTNRICKKTIHTYSSKVMAGEILRTYYDLTEMTSIVAGKLGAEAVKGYGECQCVMHDYFKVRDNISIGFCIGPNYQDCRDTAYCGASADRVALAEKLGGYKYEFPKNSSTYGSGISPGSSASELLDWGMSQTQSLMRDYCMRTPDC